MNKILETIEKQIKENEVVLYMKGTKFVPQCGFSAVVADILMKSGIDDFTDINVLENEEIRLAIKEFSDWPTIPQLYVRGEFIGGCDIVKELYENKELDLILNPAE